MLSWRRFLLLYINIDVCCCSCCCFCCCCACWHVSLSLCVLPLYNISAISSSVFTYACIVYTHIWSILRAYKTYNWALTHSGEALSAWLHFISVARHPAGLSSRWYNQHTVRRPSGGSFYIRPHPIVVELCVVGWQLSNGRTQLLLHTIMYTRTQHTDIFAVLHTSCNCELVATGDLMAKNMIVQFAWLWYVQYAHTLCTFS